jgi:hypothetical protein
MNLKEYKIVACPFQTSDMTEEYTEYGTDEKDALEQFRKKYALFSVKSVEET